MPKAKDKSPKSSAATYHMTKKCPECYTYLPLDADKCSACGKRIGPIDKLGFAQKVTNFRSYLIAAFFAAVFAAVLWVGFFTE
jgi:hypothetical protein